MKIIGITGGVGSGKSEVMNVLEGSFGAGIIIADELGHLSMEKMSLTYNAMVQTFGTEILTDSGEIDRNQLAKIIFSSDEMRKKQNAIVHPFVNEKTKELIEKYRTENRKVVAIESAILFVAEIYKYCDEVWFIKADRETRIKRLMESRGYSREKAELIMSNQFSDVEYEKRCDRVIHNNGGIDEIYAQIEKIL